MIYRSSPSSASLFSSIPRIHTQAEFPASLIRHITFRWLPPTCSLPVTTADRTQGPMSPGNSGYPSLASSPFVTVLAAPRPRRVLPRTSALPALDQREGLSRAGPASCSWLIPKSSRLRRSLRPGGIPWRRSQGLKVPRMSAGRLPGHSPVFRQSLGLSKHHFRPPF